MVPYIICVSTKYTRPVTTLFVRYSQTTGATHRLISVESWSNYGAIYHMRIHQIHVSSHYIVCKVLSYYGVHFSHHFRYASRNWSLRSSDVF